MAQVPPQGYADIPEEDQKKAKKFFDYAKTVADSGQFDYAIELYIQGLAVDPEAAEMHQALRDLSLRRKASCGKPMGMGEQWKLPKAKDDKTAMLNAEKLLAKDPGNTDHMVSLMQAAVKGGYFDTAIWIGAILFKANVEGKKPDFNKFIILKDQYKAIERWDLATQACQEASRMKPDDMDLGTECKNLSAVAATVAGKYNSAKSFRDSIRDMAGQQKLMEQDKDVRSLDSLSRAVVEAEEEVRRDPGEPGKLMKLVEALLRTEKPEHEDRAIELLDEAYKTTKQFRFRQKAGQINLMKMARMVRSLKQRQAADPNNAALKKEVVDIERDYVQAELAEFRLWSENYPTDNKIRFDVARNLFRLRNFDEAIPVLQHVRNDPKFKTEATIILGRAFLEAGYVDEAADTLKSVLDEYPAKDDKYKDMAYWYGIALEQKGDRAAALKVYSAVAQVDFNFRDVQKRIKTLRGTGQGGAGTAGLAQV